MKNLGNFTVQFPFPESDRNALKCWGFLWNSSFVEETARSAVLRGFCKNGCSNMEAAASVWEEKIQNEEMSILHIFLEI